MCVCVLAHLSRLIPPRALLLVYDGSAMIKVSIDWSSERFMVHDRR